MPHVFALLMLFLCEILYTIWPGKSLQLVCILPLCILCLFVIRMMFVKILLEMCMLVGIMECAKADSVSSVN